MTWIKSFFEQTYHTLYFINLYNFVLSLFVRPKLPNFIEPCDCSDLPGSTKHFTVNQNNNCSNKLVFFLGTGLILFCIFKILFPLWSFIFRKLSPNIHSKHRTQRNSEYTLIYTYL